MVVLGGLIWAVWKLPPLLYGDVGKASPDARLQAASSFRTALVAGLAGLAALGSLAMASRTYRLSQQGQLTERYTKAIEQLGSDKLDVRLGGIYALERIAVDSKRDHPTVVEVVSAFVREHGQPPSQPSPIGGDANDEPTEPEPMPTTDVQAAVTVLCRLPWRRDVSRGDLSGAHLEGIDLRGADLERMILDGAHLEWADLIDADLRAADLRGAHLEGAYLQGADLEGAILAGAYLERTQLLSTNLEGTILRHAYMEGANLGFTNLKGADLLRAHLRGANLCDAKLTGANLEEADLEGAELGGAHLRGVDLADVQGLTQEQLELAILDERTRLPARLRSPTGATPPQPAGEQP
jgi:hypothetical protein